MNTLVLLPLFLTMAQAPPSDVRTPEERDHTCFQEAAPYAPELDIGSDMAIVYGMNQSFAARVQGWREKGYAVGMMTGIAWGNYEDYFITPDGFRKEEVQTNKQGRLFMHGGSKTVGYNVPTPEYIAYIKEKVAPAVDAGVRAVFLEEPEYWAEAGWSEAFKREWQRHYGTPWVPPDTDVDTRYKASKLKYELYFNALREVIAHIKSRAAEQGREIECHVPTHSLINYAHWRIVSPESYLMQLDQMDGYIAQVWTGTARTPTVYRGMRRERTFECAHLEYGQILGMVRPTGRKVWFLADPVEDNPNYSWNNYKYNYESTIVASLLWPEVHRFEVMPWPARIFRGTYPKIDLDQKSGDREGIPAEYATQILAVINALNDMNQPDVEYTNDRHGIGIIVSDSMMFQRAQPYPSDPDLGSFYGLALPLIKHGIPVEIAQLETITTPGAFDRHTLLLLTYNGQKPLSPAYHEALADWVRRGGCLLYIGDGNDPYHHVREWWNEQGTRRAYPQDDLFHRMGLTAASRSAPEPFGKGYVRILEAAPEVLQHDPAGPEQILEPVRELLAVTGRQLSPRNYLSLRRGPYVVASVLEESISEEPLTLRGSFIDVFDPMLDWTDARTLAPGERTLLYDLSWGRQQGVRAKVVVAAARIRNQSLDGNVFRFSARGPTGTQGRARVLLPERPVSVEADPPVAMEWNWHEPSGTAWIAFPNQAGEIQFRVTLPQTG